MKLTKSNLFLVVALFYTLYMLFPLFADVARLPVWLPSMISVAIMFTLYPQAFRNKVFYWFLVYAAVLALFVMIGKPLTIGIGSVRDNKKIFIEFAYILPPIGIYSILTYLKSYKLTRRYVLWSIIILYASFVVAVPLMLRYSSLRAALGEQGETLTIPGLPGYSLMHAYTLFAPPLCYGIRYTKGKWKTINLIALLALSYVILSTYVTTSLIILSAIIAFTFLYSSERSFLFWMFIFLLFYMCYELGFFIDFIDWLAPFFDGTAVAPKLEDIRKSMVEGQIQGGTITGRQTLHDISLHSFMENPLWGTSVVGSHSSLLDRIGGMGILGGIPFLMIFITFTRRFRRLLFTKEAQAFFIIGIVASFLYLYEKGNWGAESWLMMMVMMPMTIWALEKGLTSRGLLQS